MSGPGPVPAYKVNVQANAPLTGVKYKVERHDRGASAPNAADLAAVEHAKQALKEMEDLVAKGKACLQQLITQSNTIANGMRAQPGRAAIALRSPGAIGATQDKTEADEDKKASRKTLKRKEQRLREKAAKAGEALPAPLPAQVALATDAGMKAGVALNPHSPVSLLSEVAEMADLVLVMSVNPGFGGQSFIENTYRKIEELRKLLSERNSQALIEVDGGVTLENASALVAAGADVLVAGSTVFRSDDPAGTIARLAAAGQK